MIKCLKDLPLGRKLYYVLSVLTILLIAFSLSGCGTSQVVIDPYAHGIDEDGIAFIVNADGHYIEVQDRCNDVELNCTDWETDYVSISTDNLAEIATVIEDSNAKPKVKKRILKLINGIRENIKHAKSLIK